jgi:hypothetical protein
LPQYPDLVACKMAHLSNRLLLSAIVLIGFFTVPRTPLHAASCVTFGAKGAYSATSADQAEAEAEARRLCGLRDNSCQVLLLCGERGYGAFATAIGPDGIVRSVGASCGLADMPSAQRRAVDYCRQNAAGTPCAVRSTWVE